MLKLSAFTGVSLLLLTMAGSAWGDTRAAGDASKRIVSSTEALDHGVVIIGGTVERLSWSGPLDWSMEMSRVKPGAPSELTVADERQLPRARPPAIARAPGLLSMQREVGSQDFINTMGVLGADPSHERYIIGPPGLSRIVGGGPLPTLDPAVSEALDRMIGR